MSDVEDIDPPEILPPTVQEVARRALVLSVVACRGFVENDQDNPESAGALVRRARDWLHAIGVENALCEWERKVIETPMGSLSDRDRINASWLSEGAAVLAWALGVSEMPAFDRQCDPAGVATRLGFLEPTAKTVLRRGQVMRTSEDLHDYNEFIYNVHWRSRDFSLNKKSYDFEALARKAWAKPLLKYGLKLTERDIALGGVPLARAKESDWRTLASICQERHRAANWLIGYVSSDFYEVPADT